MRVAILIPSYNTGRLLKTTVLQALARWKDVWVVVDGSTDGSEKDAEALQPEHPGLQVVKLPVNRGKGSAVLAGAEMLSEAGFTHVLTMDSDGQHPAALIGDFMARSRQTPSAMVLGVPVFDTGAPALRVKGRQVSNWWANLETLWMGIGDSLYGFRVYPIEPLCRVMQGQRWMRRFDFDPEAVVRLCWSGVRPVNLPAPVKYLRADEGGVSHFNYWRDNRLLTWMHTRLMFGFLLRLPLLLWRKFFPLPNPHP